MAKKEGKWIPERRCAQPHGYLTFIPNLFKNASKDVQPFDKNDPFIRPEVLRDHCSLLATKNGVPNFAANNPIVDDVINFSEEEWKDIEKSQIKWEKRDKEIEIEEEKALKLEDQQKQQREAAESHTKQTLDRKVDQIFKRHSHFIKKTCPVMIPYKSNLNHEEHKAYLRAFVKFKIRPPVTAAESAENEYYLRLQSRVYEEQQCFMQFAYQVSRLQIRVYNEVPDVINKYINEYVQNRCKRVSSYKATYVQEQPIPICPQDPTNRFSDLYMNHIGHLLSLGSVPMVKLPNPHTLCQLPLDDTVKEKENIIDPQDKEKFIHKTTVSDDPNAVYLAKEHQANIVVSTSALKVITDNAGPNFDKEWDIPVVVRSYTITDADGNEKQHRVVFIDKPLPKKIWTPSEKKQLFFKKSALSSMTEVKRVSFFRMKCPLEFKIEKIGPEDLEKTKVMEKVIPKYSEDFLDLYSTTDHDVFGPSSPPRGSKVMKAKAKADGVKSVSEKKKVECDKSLKSSMDSENKSILKNKTCETENDITKRLKLDECQLNSSKNVEMREENNHTSASASQETSSVLDNLLDMQDTLHKPTTPNSSPLKQNQDEFLRMNRSWPWSDSLETKWDDHTEAINCSNWSGENVHYQLFSMGFNNPKPFCTSPPLRILVRHGLHGLTWFKKRRGQSKAYIIYPKPEYQAYFGCEVNTLSEITHQWLDLLVRPNTTLLEVRVCQTTGDIMMSEEKTLASVLKEGKQQHIGFAPQQPLSTMYAVFNTVSALPTGDYVLHHDIKTEAFIKLLKATDSTNMSLQIVDLHSSYCTPSVYTRTHAKPPWIALDTHKLTAFHLKHYKIPGTFPMDNPSKKFTKREKKRIKEKAQTKKRLNELESNSQNSVESSS